MIIAGKPFIITTVPAFVWSGPTHSEVFPQCLGSMHGRLNKKNRVMSHKSDEITIFIWAMDVESEK